MWQVFSLASAFWNGAAQTIDKGAIVKVPNVHPAVLTFYRNIPFVFFAALFALSGIFGSLIIHISWPIVLVGIFAAAESFAYTYLLEHIEVSGIALFSYLFNFIYLIFDIFIFKAPIGAVQVVGIILLSVGGGLFVFDWKSHRIKKEYSKYVGYIFVLYVVYYGLLYYVFKYYAAPSGMGPASFLINIWVVTMMIIFVVALWKGGRTFWNPDHGLGKYMQTEVLGKFSDVLGTVLGFQALTYAAVSQVNSMYAFQPIIVLLLVIIFQKYLRFDEREDLKKGDVTVKILLALVVCLGGFLVS